MDAAIASYRLFLLRDRETEMVGQNEWLALCLFDGR